MLTLVYVMQPSCDADVDALAAEIERATTAYNAYLHHLIRWAHMRREVRCPELREVDLATELRNTPRTGRKPTPKVEVHCSGPRSERARDQSRVVRLAQNADLQKRLDALRERWEHVEVAAIGVTRSDDDELQAYEARRTYRALRDAGCHYLTIDMEQDAATRAVTDYMRANGGDIPDYAKARRRDSSQGRAGVDSSWMQWGEGDAWNHVSFCNTTWRVKPRQLRQRPITLAHREHSGAILDRYVDTAGAKIRQVYVTMRRRNGIYSRKPRYHYMLHVVMDTAHRQHEVSEQRGIAGINISWRRSGDEEAPTTRVAYVVRSDGTHEAFDLPSRIYSGIQHADSIRGLADQDVQQLRTVLGMHRMTSARTVLQRSAMSPCATPYVQEVARHARHLYDWYDGARGNLLAARDALYLQQQIIPLLRGNHTIYVPELDGSGKSKLIAKDKDAPAGSKRQLTSPLQNWLRVLQREAPKYGCRVVEVPAAYTSQQCPDKKCNTLLGPGGSARERICAGCGRIYDADYIGAANIIRRGQEMEAAAAE